MRIIFMGTPEFAVPSLEALIGAGYEIPLVITQPDRARGRGKRLLPTPIKEAAQAWDLPVFQPEQINAPESLAKIAACQPALLVVVAFGQLLKEELLLTAPLGAINVHGSLLPKYRGAAPIQHALINGEKETGVTTMYLNLGMDTGDIIHTAAIPITEEDHFASLYSGLAEIGAGLLLRTVSDIALGQAPRQPQDDSQASYAPLIRPDDERIDWQQGAAAVRNRIRGLYPKPGAHTLWQGKRLKIGQASIYEESSREQPGLMLENLPQGPRIACGEGSLCLELLQPAGKAMMKGADFQRGRGIEEGEVLGE